MMGPSGPADLSRCPSPWKLWLRRLERFFAVIGLSFVAFHATMASSIIVSPSMAPTLMGTSWYDGDRVLTERVSYWFRRPRRWEVITFRRQDGMLVMKRVVGLPGEKLQLLAKGELVINGVAVPRPAALAQLHYIPVSLVFEDRIVDCGEGYFVLGDDSMDSDDSRFEGPVPPNWIVGRAWLIMQPWSRFGWVNRAAS